MPAPCPRHARATPSQKWPIARAMPAPLSCSPRGSLCLGMLGGALADPDPLEVTSYLKYPLCALARSAGIPSDTSGSECAHRDGKFSVLTGSKIVGPEKR
eukprot:gene10091-biopygen212